jgi:prepilin-type N-terminal cleavage/methylation domain-containing protein
VAARRALANPSQGDQTMKRKRGLTLVELLIVMIIIVILIALLLPVTSRRGPVRMTKDQTQIKQIHAAWVTFGRDFDGVFPTPDLINRDRGTDALAPDPENLKANTSAAMYSVSIMMNYLTPNILVSPTEPSGLVAVKDDYDWSLYNPAENVYWDADPEGNPPPNARPGYVPFATNLSSKNPHTGSPICNASYAHTPLCGERKAREWKGSLNSRWAALGNRGVICGEDQDEKVFNASITLEFYGSRKQWIGNIGYNDNHVELHDTFYPEGLTFLDSNNLTMPDNLFRNDSQNGDCGSGLGIDAFLTLVSDITDREACTITTEWD